MNERNPFLGPEGYGAVSVEDRMAELESFTSAECKAALKVPGLQGTVKDALERRIDRLVEHHHRTKGKGRSR